MDIFEVLLKISADFIGTLMMWLYHSGNKSFSELEPQKDKRVVGIFTLIAIGLIYVAIRYQPNLAFHTILLIFTLRKFTKLWTFYTKTRIRF